VVVVGAGAAGMYQALRAAEAGARVVLVSRKPLREAVRESASYWAQGGLAAALAPGDFPERHAQDTLNAGRGLCRTAAVEVLVREAPGAVEELISRGVGFDTRPDGSLALALEGGHTARRIVHAGGAATGKALTDRLIEFVEASPARHRPRTS
jgi:L-aspartate oxidase